MQSTVCGVLLVISTLGSLVVVHGQLIDPSFYEMTGSAAAVPAADEAAATGEAAAAAGQVNFDDLLDVLQMYEVNTPAAEERESQDTHLYWSGSRRPHHPHHHLSDEVSFSWSDCGGGSDPGHVKSISISPDPVKMPGTITVSFQFQLNSNISSPISVDLEIKKKIAFVWVKVKTYHFNDVCTNLAKITCPPQFQQCHCPFNKGTYTAQPITLVSKQSAPGGSYRVTAWFKQGNTEKSCVYALLSVK